VTPSPPNRDTIPCHCLTPDSIGSELCRDGVTPFLVVYTKLYTVARLFYHSLYIYFYTSKYQIWCHGVTTGLGTNEINGQSVSMYGARPYLQGFGQKFLTNFVLKVQLFTFKIQFSPILLFSTTCPFYLPDAQKTGCNGKGGKRCVTTSLTDRGATWQRFCPVKNNRNQPNNFRGNLTECRGHAIRTYAYRRAG
jgi:hypothetical protein